MLLVAGVVAAFVLTSQARAASFDPGLIEIAGTTSAASTNFDVEELGSPTLTVPGQTAKGWPLRQILIHAQDKTGAFDIDGFVDPVEISRTGGEINLEVDQRQVAQASYDEDLPIYFLDADGILNMREPGGRVWTYSTSNPQVFIPKSGNQVSVDIKPDGPISIQAGQAVTFKAKVSNPGQAPVSLTWNVDGAPKQSGNPVEKTTFRSEFPKEGSFTVAVIIMVDGASADADSVVVNVGKVPKQKKKKKKNQQNEGNETPTDDGGYIPGYTDGGYGGGSGTGTGTGIPSTGSPSPSPRPDKQDRKDEDQTPVDDGLETVSGQLVDPSQISTVVPPSDSTSPTTEAEPADEGKNGGGISDGALTALGIGALLGLGGLAEAGAFAGFRRFRFRL